MEIIKCEEKDIIAVGEFYDKVVEFLEANINYPKWIYKDYPSEKTVRNTVGKGQQFMCVEDGKIIGAFILNDDPQGKYENAAWSKIYKEGEYMVCHTLASAPEVSEQGIGTKMVEFCIQYAKEHGFKSLRLDVVPDNYPAKRLYEKCGFRYVGDVDLEKNIEAIPLFSMYEYNF